MPDFTITSLRDQIQSDLSNAPVTSSFTGTQINELPPVVVSPGSGGSPNIGEALAQHRSINVSGFGTGKYKFFISISTTGNAPTAGGISGQGPVRNFLGGVYLPLPHPLVDTLAVEYEQYAFGPGWGGAIQSAPGVVNNLSQGNILGALGEVGSAATGFVTSIANQNSGGLVNAGSQLAFGLAVNQFYTILLKGPKFKEYAFEWHLLPQNLSDSQDIVEIIRILRAAAAVEQGGPGNIFWQFPNVVQCSFSPQSGTAGTHPLYVFKPAVMTSVQAHYDPYGAAFYRNSGGYPESVRLRIEFLELEFWLQRDFS